MDKKYIVYEIKNNENGKRYIGRTGDYKNRQRVHLNLLNKNKHHSYLLQEDWNKYQPIDFVFAIIAECLTEQDSADLEEYLINQEYEKLYNISKNSRSGDLISYHPKKEEIVERMRESVIARYSTMNEQEKRDKHGQIGERNGMFGRTHSKDSRNKISSKLKGKNSGENNHMFGKKLSKERREKLSILAKQRTGCDNPFYGKNHSDAFKQRMSELKKGSKPTNSRPVLIDGAEYESVADAARTLEVCNATIIHRIKSPNNKYKNYFYKELI